MPTIGNSYPTLLNMAGRFHNGVILPIAEVLSKDNEILADIPFAEANEIFGHRLNRRGSKPTGSYRKLNSGVATEKSNTVPDYEGIAFLEAWSQLDAALVEGAPDPVAYRRTEDEAFIEGMRDTFASTLIYGSTNTTPEKMDGLAQRITTLSSTSVNGVANVIGASGTGSDVTSIWIVQWGPRRVYMAYPKGSMAGLDFEDFGKQPITDSDGNLYTAYRSHFMWKSGLVVEDDRCIQRIANIESAGSSNIFDEDDLITALNRLPFGGRGAVIYANRTIKTQMDINAKDKSNVNYTSGEIFGMPVTNFRGVPVRQVDAILDTETALS